MLAQVTNRSSAARGFQSLDRGTVMIEPGASASLDLADHDVHRTWEAAGEVAIVLMAEAEHGAQRSEEKPKQKRR